MRLPDGWIFTLREEDRLTIGIEEKKLIMCRNCRYYQDNNGGYPHPDCKWREDETPDPEDFCSAGEAKEEHHRRKDIYKQLEGVK